MGTTTVQLTNRFSKPLLVTSFGSDAADYVAWSIGEEAKEVAASADADLGDALDKSEGYD